MIDHDLYVLAVALVISGFIAYKTFQWWLYEEIGLGSAALFLGFAVTVFFVINHHDFGKRLIEQRERRQADDAALRRISAELQKQGEAIRLLSETMKKTPERVHPPATEADKSGQLALETVKKSQEKSEEVVSVTAWATWEILMGEFLELEDYLKRWEEKNGLKRGWDKARSLPDLAKKLERFDAEIPEPIKTLYFERQRKYEILKKIKESSETTVSRHAGTGFRLPAPPSLPAAVIKNKDTE